MVRIRVDHSTWDRQSSPHPHVLAIYLKLVYARGTMSKRFEECQGEDDDVRLHCQTWIPNDNHYHWLRDPINPLPMGC